MDERRTGERADGIGLADVGGEGKHGAALAIRHGRGLLQLRHASASQRYRISGGLQGQCGSPANTAARAGNDRYLAEILSQCIPPQRGYFA